MRKSVVLPQPDGPSRAKKAPRATSSETRSTATVAPKRLLTPSRRRKGASITLTMRACPPAPWRSSASGLQPRPGAGALALVLRRDRRVEEEALLHLGG